MQIHEITRQPLKELTSAGAVTPKVTYGPGFFKTTAASSGAQPAAAPATSGAQPQAATATPARTSGSIGSTGVPGGGLANVVGGTLGALGKSLMSKAFGGVDVMGKYSGAAMNRSQALKLGQDMARTLMPVLQKNWAAKVQAAMAQSIDPATKAPATSPAKLDGNRQALLRKELVDMVNQVIQPNYRSYTYTSLPQSAGDDATPEGRQEKARAMQTVQDINQAIEGIFKATLAGTDPAQDWQTLVVNGIAPAQGIIANDTGSAYGRGYSGRAPVGNLTAQQLALLHDLGINQEAATNFMQALQNPTDAAVLAPILKQALKK